MSRVIKFRCWNAFSNYMHDWNEMVEKNKIHLLSNENKSYVCEQFTGLTDKNGVEIYEGDVVYCVTRDPLGNPEQAVQFVVEFDYGSFLAMTASEEQEVIGNIHQNPELIK